MARVRPVFDTNILIDYLAGIPQAKEEVERCPAAYVSTVTWIEVMAGTQNGADEQTVRQFLQYFEHVPVDQAVADLAFQIRREHRLKVPDAVIWATARHKHTLLTTRNTKDFPETNPDIRIPYKL